MRNVLRWVGGLVVAATVVAGSPASAASITFGGATANLDGVDLTLLFEPGDTGVDNLVSHLFVVGFSGLVLDGAPALGTVYDGVAVLDFSELLDCGDITDPCWASDPPTPPTAWQWVSFVLADLFEFGDGTGSLLSMSFLPAIGSTTWSLAIFGDEQALQWEPVPCLDVHCFPDIHDVPYQLGAAGLQPDAGFAAVIADLNVRSRTDPDPDPDPVPMPEPSMVWLLMAGAAAALRRHRRC